MLIKLTGWTFAQLDEQPAARCDWLLAIDGVAKVVEADAAGGRG